MKFGTFLNISPTTSYKYKDDLLFPQLQFQRDSGAY
jgi:hypothetical protein